MDINPYTGIIKALRSSEQPKETYVGHVLSTSPVRVSYSGIDFAADEIYMNPDIEIADGDSVCVLPDGDDIILICKVEKHE